VDFRNSNKLGVHVGAPISNDPEPDEQLYLLLTELFYLLDDADRQFFGEYSLSTRQFWALSHLRESGGLSMVDLSRMLFTDKSNVTGIADKLEAAGLIKRGPAPQDRRVILLTLTPEGIERYEQVLTAHQQRIRALMGSNEVALRQAIRILDPIRSRFKQHLHPAQPAPATQANLVSGAEKR
jgi:DNA-binding MarR family transcriptional regulator